MSKARSRKQHKYVVSTAITPTFLEWQETADSMLVATDAVVIGFRLTTTKIIEAGPLADKRKERLKLARWLVADIS